MALLFVEEFLAIDADVALLFATSFLQVMLMWHCFSRRDFSHGDADVASVFAKNLVDDVTVTNTRVDVTLAEEVTFVDASAFREDYVFFVNYFILFYFFYTIIQSHWPG